MFHKKVGKEKKETKIGAMGKKLKKGFAFYCIMVLILIASSVTALSTFIFGLIRAIGMILLGFGIVQVGLSLKSHDPSQRANGFLTLAGGIIITFAKEILNTITG